MPESDYIQLIEGERLIALATEQDLLIEVPHHLGDFVTEGAELMRVFPECPRDGWVARDLPGLVALGRRRTLQQDAEFGIRQIGDIDVKAMSPSINDPATALVCLNHLEGLLTRMAVRHDPQRVRGDAAGRPRLIVGGPSFESVAWLFFTPLRTYGSHDPNVVLRYLEVLQHTAELVRGEDRRDVLWSHARMLANASEPKLKGEMERERVNARLGELGRALHRDPVPSMF